MSHDHCRPLILLDVDGVVNVMPEEGRVPVWPDFAQTESGIYDVRWSATLVARLGALDADIAFLTTWEHRANAILGPLFDWPERRVLEERFKGRALPGWWKARSADEALSAERRPFIWIDDDLAYSLEEGDVPWMADVDVPHLLVSPDPRDGITPRQLEAISAFVASGSVPAPGEVVAETLRLRPLVAADLRANDVLERALYAERAWSICAWEAWLARPDHFGFVLEDSGRLIGTGAVEIDRESAIAYVASLGIAPDHRRRGLGRLLLERLLATGEEEGCTAAMLHVATTATEALALYRSLGFEEKGLVPDYYGEHGDAVLLWRPPD